MLTRLFHTAFETGPLPVRLDVYADDGAGPTGAAAIAAATGTSVEVEAATGSKLRWERGETAYGLHVYASFIEVQLFDPGLVRETFRGAFDERDFLAVISASTHVTAAGTEVPGFIWYGQPMRAQSVQTIAPAVYPQGSTTLRLYDGIGRLTKRNGRSTTRTTVAEAACEPVLRINRHLNLYLAFAAFPPEALDAGGGAFSRRDPRNLRFAGELAGDAERGEFGLERGQLDRALEGLGLTLYQHTTPDGAAPEAGAPSWRMVPRSAVGGAVPSAWHASGYEWHYASNGAISSDYDVADLGLPGDVVALDEEDLGGAASDVAEEVEAAAAVKLTQAGGANLLRTPPPLSAPGSDLLTAVSPVEGVFVRFSAETLFGFSGRLRLRLEGASGTSYALQRVDGEGTVWVAGGDNLFTVTNDGREEAATEPFPEAGDLWLDRRDQDGGDDAVFTRLEVSFVDAGGDPVTDWVVTVNPDPASLAEGEIVGIRRPPAIEVLGAEQGASWETPASWESLVLAEGPGGSGAPRSFSTIGAHLAEYRLAQQGRPLAAPRCTVAGLHGPGRVLRFPAANLYREGALVEQFGVPCVVGGGLVLDLDAGATEGGWTELTTSGLTTGGLDE